MRYSNISLDNIEYIISDLFYNDRTSNLIDIDELNNIDDLDYSKIINVACKLYKNDESRRKYIWKIWLLKFKHAFKDRLDANKTKSIELYGIFGPMQFIPSKSIGGVYIGYPHKTITFPYWKCESIYNKDDDIENIIPFADYIYNISSVFSLLIAAIRFVYKDRKPLVIFQKSLFDYKSLYDLFENRTICKIQSTNVDDILTEMRYFYPSLNDKTIYKIGEITECNGVNLCE